MKSKLVPHLDFIVDLRRRGLSYRACCVELGKIGIKAESGNLCRWIKVQRRRAQRMARELAPFNVLPGSGGGESKPMPSGTRFEYDAHDQEITK